MKERDQEHPALVVQSSKISSADSLSQAMSQVSIKALEIIVLRKLNKDLMDMVEVKEGIRKKLEERCKELEDKNNKLAKLFSG